MSFKTSTQYYPFAANESGEIKNVITGVIRKQHKNNSGYLVVGNSKKTYYSHRVVLDAFTDDEVDTSNLQVNHINGIKDDNRVSNLEWVTRSENMAHAAQNNLLCTSNGFRGEKSNLSKHSDEDVHLICKMIQEGRRNIDIEKETGFSKSYVKDVRGGKVRADISDLYQFPDPSKKSVSDSTVQWVCRNIEQGKGIKEIVEMSTNPKVTVALVKNIKYGKCYYSISKQYIW